MNVRQIETLRTSGTFMINKRTEAVVIVRRYVQDPDEPQEVWDNGERVSWAVKFLKWCLQHREIVSKLMGKGHGTSGDDKSV
jgi:hypothetical protein